MKGRLKGRKPDYHEAVEIPAPLLRFPAPVRGEREVAVGYWRH
jgi:hypothetical protein